MQPARDSPGRGWSCAHEYGNDAEGTPPYRAHESEPCAHLHMYVCVFFLQAVKLSHWALLRDSIYYTFAITALIAVRGHGGHVHALTRQSRAAAAAAARMLGPRFGLETKQTSLSL